jgi:hypothetical protein
MATEILKTLKILKILPKKESVQELYIYPPFCSLDTQLLPNVRRNRRVIPFLPKDVIDE